MRRLKIIVFLCITLLCATAPAMALEETEAEMVTRTTRQKIEAASSITPPAKGNVLRLEQKGASNTSDIMQTNDLAVAEVLQDGVGNSVTIAQENYYNLSMAVVRQHGVGNTATVTQKQSGNYAYAKQAGHNNSVDISQDGHMNTAWVHQSGNRNEVDIKQTSSGNTAVCKQNGNDNIATIRQYGAMVNEVIQVGNGHTINVSTTIPEGVTVYQGWK